MESSDIGSSRFRVSVVCHDNPSFDSGGEVIPPDCGRNSVSKRLSVASVTEFFGAILPGRRKTSTLQPIGEDFEGLRRSSRANSIFVDLFREAGDRSLVDYDIEAAPRLESYRNSLTAHNYIIRPTLDELHQAQASHPEVSSGKGLDTGAVKFGWIKGVYVRCLLNIWGVMLFLRMGWMTGQCGIILALVIILLSSVVTVITTLSMSAICTNGDVRGGGAYYLISRSLGPEFGGVVGILLFLANAISGAMYIIGAGEAIRDILREVGKGIVEFPSGINDIRLSGFLCLLLMMSVTGFGMEFENKTQIVLLFILLVAMMDYYVGAFLPPTPFQISRGFVGWSAQLGLSNMMSDFRGETFFSVFAVFFPSVTGILAGANISGDLKDPCMAIPRGTFLAIFTTSISYAALVVWLGFTSVRDASGSIGFNITNCTVPNCLYGLQNDNQIMKLASGFGPLIYAGIFAATLSSALVSIVSAPRILQALCVDGIIPWLNWFGKGYGKDNDPRRALALTFIIAVVFTVIGDLNVVAPIISNFFMAAMGLINFSCFHASYVKSPGFRPGFRYYNLWLSLLGALLCVFIMFVMSWITALITDVFALAIYIYIAKTCPDINWGSSFQGYSYRNALYYLNKLSRVEEHVKNFRPGILALTGNVGSRPQLVDLAAHLTKDHGLQICVHILKEKQDLKTKKLLNELNSKWLHDRKVKAFYTLMESETLVTALESLLQVCGIGKMKPNILLMGYKENWQICNIDETVDYFNAIHQIMDANMSLCILRVPGGTDYSKYFETKEGFPVLQGQDKVKPDLKLPEIKVSLETVVEEEPDCTSYHEINLDDDVEVQMPPNFEKIANMFHFKQEKGFIDVWWLYDDGGLTLLLPYILTTRSRFKDSKLRVFSIAQENSALTDEQINLAALLQKFRIPFKDLTVLAAEGDSLHVESTKRFEKIVSKWLTKDENEKNPASITRSTLNSLKKRTNQFLRLRELLEKYSKSSNLIVMTMPLPRREGSTAPLYMAWLETLTEGLPPFLLVRGNQTTVLTFYS